MILILSCRSIDWVVFLDFILLCLSFMLCLYVLRELILIYSGYVCCINPYVFYFWVTTDVSKVSLYQYTKDFGLCLNIYYIHDFVNKVESLFTSNNMLDTFWFITQFVSSVTLSVMYWTFIRKYNQICLSVIYLIILIYRCQCLFIVNVMNYIHFCLGEHLFSILFMYVP